MKRFLIGFFFTLLVSVGIAQTAPVLFAVFEDQVKPSMDASYREAVKKLKDACQQNKINAPWRTVAFDDNSYFHLVPIKNFADLDKNMFADLQTKLGTEAFGNLWADIDKCVESHTSFVTSLMPNLSYLSPAPDENFRNVLFWYYEPGKDAEAENIIMEWNKLYASKKAPGGVLTYKVLFGREPGYAFSSWGKNRPEHALKMQKNNELFGEEAAKLWAKTLLITKKYYTKTAYNTPELSHSLPSPAN